MPDLIQLRRALLKSDWLASSIILAEGEPGVAIDTGECRYGNGTQTWANLPVGSSGSGTVAWTSITGKPTTFPPDDASVTNAKVASGAAISLDKTVDSASRFAMTSAQSTKLAGIATGATVNDTDANLKNRANHTGTQLASTISDLTSAVQALLGSLGAAMTVDSTATSRPTVPSGMRLIIVGGTTPVSWIQTGDIQLMTP